MATVIRRDTATPPAKVHYLSNATVCDGGANLIHAYVRNDGGTAYVRLTKVAPDGSKVDLPPVQGPEGSKVDGVALVQSGRDLHVVMTSHVGDQNTMLSVEVLQGACVPYPGNPQLGMEGAYVPVVAESDPVDYARIGAMVDGAAAQLEADLVRAFGSGSIRQGIEDKVKDAVRELGLWSQSLQDRGLDQWLRDRVYEVLRDNGLIRGGSDAHAERLDAIARNETLEGKE